MGTKELAEFISNTSPPEEPTSKKSKSALVRFLKKTYPKGAHKASNVSHKDENNDTDTALPAVRDSELSTAVTSHSDLRASDTDTPERDYEKAHRVLGKKKPHDEAKALRVLGESRRLNQVIPPPAECLPEKKKRNPFHKIQKILGIKRKKEKEKVEIIQPPTEVVQEAAIPEQVVEEVQVIAVSEEQISMVSTVSVKSSVSEPVLEEEEPPVQGPLPEEPMKKLIYQSRSIPTFIRIYRYFLGLHDRIHSRWTSR